MTSKQQERAALAKIQKIIADLGEGSYIGTAFEGCFEIAEQNIENDFACSMKQRAESAEAKLQVLETQREAWEITARDLREALARTKEAAKLDVEKKQAEIDAIKAKDKEKLEEVRSLWADDQKKLPSVKLFNTIWEIMYDQEEAIQASMEQHASTMADFADAPKDIAFQHAVKWYKKDRENLKTVRWVQEELDKINPGR